MRVVWFVMGIVLTFGFLGFLVTNFDTHVPVTVFTTVYPSIPLWLVVLVALLVMSVLVGVAAIIEGAAVRLENRGLRREVHKLETEINYLRTQPSLVPRAGDEERPAPRPAAAARDDDEMASAPVYGSSVDEWPPESDDDTYSGGRAV